MFTVEDLKPGMLVEMKDKGYGILLPFKGDKLGICVWNGTSLSLATTRLRFYPEPGLIEGYSIIRVWDLAEDGKFNLLSPGDSELLLDCSKKEMTLEEIEKELGYRIKIVNKK